MSTRGARQRAAATSNLRVLRRVQVSMVSQRAANCAAAGSSDERRMVHFAISEDRDRSMELVIGALPNLLPKLRDLLVGGYKLQKGVKGEIRFVLTKLETMKGDLEKALSTPAAHLDDLDEIWARQVRELSYDLEDRIDTFMVRSKGSDSKKFIDRSIDLLAQPNVLGEIAVNIRDIKYRVERICSMRGWCSAAKPVSFDPHSSILYKETAELIGIAESRNELINILMEGNEVSKQQVKIVSIVGFGGLGKTTLANAVYEKLRAQFDCSAFVSVSQNFDLKKLFKEIFYELGMEKDSIGTLDHMQLISELREFLREKRYFIVFDDIWDISVWNLIRQTLPDDNSGSKIITTTRNFKVAEQIGGAYRMKPVSLHESRELLYSRIFGNKESETYPDEELAEVSHRILKKCAGVPLAITTIASLLANSGTSEREWYSVYNNVGTGLDYSPDVENMRKILSSSYNDLPYHLRACLLYLSAFPEGHKIEKHRLIWMWIAEGFIRCDEGESLFESGDNYVSELINRSLIQLVYDVYDVNDDIIEYCHTHTMMLDLICYLSREQNFVTIFNDLDNHIHECKNIRKLSLQNIKEYYSVTWGTTSMEQVRSVVVFPAAVNLIPALSNFRVLRVLDLQDCSLSEGRDLKYLGILFHLRYLGLRCTGIAKLPEEVGNLQFLQILDVKYNEISELPMTVVNLRELKCLHIDGATRVPKGFASLTSLQELSGSMYDVTDIEDVGCLTQLRVLDISFHIECMDTLQKYLVQSLNKLPKVQDFCIRVASGECKGDEFVFPQHTHRLVLRGCWLSKLPAWVNPSLMKLSVLSIAITEVRQEHLEILGMLPSLRYLNLKVDHENLGIQGRFIVGTCLFPCLEWCMLWGFRGPVVFERGAMLKLRSLRFTTHVRDMREIAGSNDDAFDIFFKNLPSLQNVIVFLRCEGASETEVLEAKAALRHASKIHPNRPTIDVMG